MNVKGVQSQYIGNKGVQPGGTVYTGADFGGRFGMTRHQFQNITQCLSFADPKPAGCKYNNHNVNCVGHLLYCFVGSLDFHQAANHGF